MDGGESTHQELDATVTRYLQSWGLREFHDEATYYAWQRETLSPQDLRTLQSLVEQRLGGENVEADIQFYDLLATPSFLPVLYSQRFDFFRQIGLLLSPRISSAERVLDFGCGVGILTCFLAQQHPEVQFVGMDRSPRSIEVAEGEVLKRHLSNVQFHLSQNHGAHVSVFYDRILSTHVLFQSEKAPGLPSKHWRTFERMNDRSRQEELEGQTGLSGRLEAILRLLSTRGRLLCVEKTWNLGRRIFFQRALNEKGLVPLHAPQPCSYHELGERKMDGPLYELSRASPSETLMWNEDPYHSEGETLYRCVGGIAERMGRELGMNQPHEIVRGRQSNVGAWIVRFGIWEQAMAWGMCETESGLRGLLLGSVREQGHIFSLLGNVEDLTDVEFVEVLQACWGNFRDATQNDTKPGYENHFSSAQLVYEALPEKIVQQESTCSDGMGKEMHMEMGTTKSLSYLYWANTFDQRQLLLMDEQGAELLRDYYRESLDEARDSSGKSASPPS